MRDDLPFDLRSLQVFVAVCEAGTMAGAARRLGLTQPAVSQVVLELERQTGAQLFDRRVRPIGLTPAGALLRRRAGPLLAEARQIAPLLRDARRGRLPHLRLGLVDSLTRLLSVAVAECLLGHADQVSLLSGLTSAHANALMSRHLDLFIGVDDLEDVDGLERWPILQEPYILILPAGWPGETADLAELGRRSAPVRYSARSSTGMEIERYLRRLGLDLAAGAEFDGPHGVTAMVAAGKGWAITTPLCLAEADLAAAQLRCLKLPGPGIGRRLTLISRRQELGPLPRRLAEVAWRRLRERLVPRIERDIPWAQLVVGHG